MKQKKTKLTCFNLRRLPKIFLSKLLLQLPRQQKQNFVYPSPLYINNWTRHNIIIQVSIVTVYAWNGPSATTHMISRPRSNTNLILDDIETHSLYICVYVCVRLTVCVSVVNAVVQQELRDQSGRVAIDLGGHRQTGRRPDVPFFRRRDACARYEADVAGITRRFCRVRGPGVAVLYYAELEVFRCERGSSGSFFFVYELEDLRCFVGWRFCGCGGSAFVVNFVFF